MSNEKNENATRRMSLSRIHNATTKILADRELHRVVDWMIYAAREEGRNEERSKLARSWIELDEVTAVIAEEKRLKNRRR